MKKKLTIIHPDGKVELEEYDNVPSEDDDDSEARQKWLATLQKSVSGYIQMVPHFDQYDGKPCEAWVNEECRINNMPMNEKATALWKFLLGDGPFSYEPLLFGPLVIVQDVQ